MWTVNTIPQPTSGHQLSFPIFYPPDSLLQPIINGFIFQIPISIFFHICYSFIRVNLVIKVPSKESTDWEMGKVTHRTLTKGNVQLYQQRSTCYLGIGWASLPVQECAMNWAVGLQAGACAAVLTHSCKEQHVVALLSSQFSSQWLYLHASEDTLFKSQ